MRQKPEAHLNQPAILPPGTGHRRGGFRVFSLVSRWFAGLLVMSALAFTPTPGLSAQTPAPAPLSSNRFLFVVDISAPMRKHTAAIVGVVKDILGSSASGQLHDGDSIGVWTFNEDVYTGNLPLQTWTAEDNEEITLRIGEFLRQQDFGKKSSLEYAMTAVDKVVNVSDIITVFIISSGAGPIRGTPFDREINAQYIQCLRDMGKKPMPLVTVLQGSRGKFIRSTVNALPWPVVIPELPIPLKIAGETPAKPAAAPVQRAPSMILVGTNAMATPSPPPVQPASATAQAPPQAPALPPPRAAVIRPPAGASPQIPAPAAPVPAPPTQSPPVVAMNTPFMPPVAPATAPIPAPPVPARVSETPTPTPVAPPPAAVVRSPASGELPLVPPQSPPVVQNPRPATETTEPNVVPTAPASATPKPMGAAAPVSKAASPAPAQAPRMTLTAQAAALIKSYTGAHRNLLVVGGACVLALVTGLILLLARRSRPSGRVSLITQTMDDRRR